MKLRVQVQLKEILGARRGEVYRLLAALELIRVQMYKVPGLRAGQSIHHKEKDHKVDHSKVVVPNKLDLSKVELNKVDFNKTDLNRVEPSKQALNKTYPNKVDQRKVAPNKTHSNKMDPSRVDQSKVVLNR